jgi:hypothetical protein
VAYDQLYKECVNARKKNKTLFRRLNIVENENVSLRDLLIAVNENEKSLRLEREFLNARLIELNDAMDRKKVENSLLLDRVHVLEKSKETSKVEPLALSPTIKLDQILVFKP